LVTLQVDAVKNFWTQFGVNVVDHHMHEEGVTMRQHSVAFSHSMLHMAHASI